MHRIKSHSFNKEWKLIGKLQCNHRHYISALELMSTTNLIACIGIRTFYFTTKSLIALGVSCKWHGHHPNALLDVLLCWSGKGG